ncbi:hypothetical protein KY345_02030 [Candidatus Woesearchaeota archaeon]|nr:hypothetical protein [Candidatus Woesearchaeota archaeon]
MYERIAKPRNPVLRLVDSVRAAYRSAAESRRNAKSREFMARMYSGDKEVIQERALAERQDYELLFGIK